MTDMNTTTSGQSAAPARTGAAPAEQTSAPRISAETRIRIIATAAVLVGVVLLLLPFLVPFGWLGQEAAAIVSWLFGIVLVGYGGSRLVEAASERRYRRSLRTRLRVETHTVELAPDEPADNDEPALARPSKRPFASDDPAPRGL